MGEARVKRLARLAKRSMPSLCPVLPVPGTSNDLSGIIPHASDEKQEAVHAGGKVGATIVSHATHTHWSWGFASTRGRHEVSVAVFPTEDPCRDTGVTTVMFTLSAMSRRTLPSPKTPAGHTCTRLALADEELRQYRKQRLPTWHCIATSWRSG